MSRQWTQEELIVAKAIGDFETLWQATIPLVKMQYGRMVRSGAVPEPEYKGDDQWLQEMLLLAGEAMRKWDPEKGAFSTYVISTISRDIGMSIDREARSGITARRLTRGICVVSTEEQRPGVPPDDEADDDGTFGAALAYGGLVERDRRPRVGEAPEGLGDPADEAVRLEQQAGLVAALACLPPDEREALLATQTDTQEESAARLGIPRTSLQRRIERASALLRQFLESGTN